jgi:hypothetical protein
VFVGIGVDVGVGVDIGVVGVFVGIKVNMGVDTGVDVPAGVGVPLDNGLLDGAGELVGGAVFPISTAPTDATMRIIPIKAIKIKTLRFNFHPQLSIN